MATCSNCDVEEDSVTQVGDGGLVLLPGEGKTVDLAYSMTVLGQSAEGYL